MTQKLYYEDAYIKEFDAVVTGCERKGERFYITLDRSAFYPEGGGQSGDRGALILRKLVRLDQNQPRVEVLDTHEKGGDIYVICDQSIAAGTQVHGIIDWTFRFDRMQNHSGEHIVSGLIHARFGYNNVGFHMSADRMTIDLDGEIPEEGLSAIERRANEIVWENVPVRTHFYSHDEIKDMEYRSKKELAGEIRLVTVEGADVCACCGTHVAYTGEIGMIKFLSHERFRGGVRLEMMCGRWAFEYMDQVFCQNHAVSVHLSSKMLETGEAARRLAAENARLKGQLIGMLYAQIDKKAQEMEHAGDVLLFVPDQDSVAAQKLAAKVMETCGGIAGAFAGSDEDGYKYAVGWKDGDLKGVVKEMNAALQGRGGGRPFFQQGSVQTQRDRIEAFWRERYPGVVIDTL